jgi:hypothetical protein
MTTQNVELQETSEGHGVCNSEREEGKQGLGERGVGE